MDTPNITLTDVTKQDKRDQSGTKTRVYVSPATETVLDNFVGRFSRPVPLMRLAMNAALRSLGIVTAKAVWSQKAGCSCGCSPAFILAERLGFDIYVTFTGAPGVDPAKAGIAAQRAAAIAADATMPGGVRAASVDAFDNWTEAEKRAAYGDR
jgi:hypothetical protein